MANRISEAEARKLFLDNDLKPLEPFVSTMTAWKCKCLRCGNIVSPKYNKVRIRGHQCGFCAGTRLTEKQVLETVKRIGHTPLEPYKGATTPWKMKCGGCGSVISPKYNSLQQGRWACGNCGHKRGAEIRRELSEPKAISALKAASLKPLVKFPGSQKPWKSECLICGSICSPRLSGILSGQGGCKNCGRIRGAKSRMLSEDEARKIALSKKLKPLEPYKGTAANWKCKCQRCGQIVSPRLNTLRNSVYGCGYCAGKIVKESDAIKKMKAVRLKPLVPYPGNSGQPWLSECLKCHREVSPSYDGISAGQGGCIWCAGKRVDPVTAIQIMKDKGLQPLEPFVSASTKWKCKCLRCLKTVSPSYKQVSTAAGGCKYCAPNFVNIPVIMKTVKQAGFTPVDKYKNASSQWKVIHEECGRTIYITYDSIRAGHNCKYCAGLFIDEEDAIEIMSLAGFRPLTKYPGAKFPWPSKCLTCNRKVSPQLSSVKNRGGGCIYCTGHKVDPQDAVKLMKINALKPLEPYTSSTTPWLCICQKCKREVTPTYSAIREGQGGCRFCADWGIDYTAPGFIYLMFHKDLRALKVGIGGEQRSRGRDRIKQHEKHGWELYKKLSFDTADSAFQVEQATLSWIRKTKKLPVFLSLNEMPQGGYSETFSDEAIDMKNVWARIIKLSKINE